jgi:hypothetical protein
MRFEPQTHEKAIKIDNTLLNTSHTLRHHLWKKQN